MREPCPMTCPQKRGFGQGHGCACSTEATRRVVAAIAWRIARWVRETPEQPLLLLFIALWTWFTAANWNRPPF